MFIKVGVKGLKFASFWVMKSINKFAPLTASLYVKGKKSNSGWVMI